MYVSQKLQKKVGQTLKVSIFFKKRLVFMGWTLKNLPFYPLNFLGPEAVSSLASNLGHVHILIQHALRQVLEVDASCSQCLKFICLPGSFATKILSTGYSR